VHQLQRSQVIISYERMGPIFLRSNISLTGNAWKWFSVCSTNVTNGPLDRLRLWLVVYKCFPYGRGV
jgi:hypothetical protein